MPTPKLNISITRARALATYQTMKWTTVGNVSVTANNTTTIALP